jgi:basic membrane protein A and related proteins
MKRRTRLTGIATLLALLLALGVVAAGCGGEEAAAPPAPPAEPAEPAPAEPAPPAETAPAETAPAETGAAAGNAVTKMAVVAPEKANDYGWNQQGVEGAVAAAESVGAEIEVVDGAGYEDITPVLRQLAEGGTQFIVAQASGYNTAAPEVSVEFNVPVIVYDNPGAQTPGLVANVTTSSQEGAYLAGILAARTTQTGTLGIVISADDVNWNKQAGGFVAGARSVSPDVQFLLAQIGQAGYADAAGGRRVTETVIAGGADVVFGMGDGSSFGMIQAVETAAPPEGAEKVWFIDVIGDKTSIDENGVLLSSVLWSFDGTYEQALADISAGTYGETDYDLNVGNGGISLLQTEHIPEDVWAEIETAMAGIQDGSIEIPVIEDKAGVEALIEG